MKFKFGNQKVGFFALGAAVATLGVKALKSKPARDLAVNTLACGMKIQDEAKEAYENIKEDAQDLVHDAKVENLKKED